MNFRTSFIRNRTFRHFLQERSAKNYHFHVNSKTDILLIDFLIFSTAKISLLILIKSSKMIPWITVKNPVLMCAFLCSFFKNQPWALWKKSTWSYCMSNISLGLKNYPLLGPHKPSSLRNILASKSFFRKQSYRFS